MLKIRFKDGRAEAITLDAPGKTIGKGSVNDLVIEVDGVNGFHADLKVDGSNIVLSDVNTQTGTRLNGQDITAPVPVRDGDVIEIQGVELEVFEEQVSGESKTLVLSGTALLDLGSNGWSIVADSGPEKGQVIAVKEKIIIGRALECDLSILEPALSRRHAELDVIGDEMILSDLGSSNGTYVNGDKIEERSLADGDVIQFNRIKFIVRAPS